MALAAGHDASGAKDELGREPLARQIYQCLKPVDANWSVRVGLFGSWGLGKTTVADWIRQWAIEEGHVAVNFKIAAESKDTIFHALSVAIYDALKDGRLASTMGSLYRNSIVAVMEAFSENDRLAAESRWLASVSAFEKVVAVAPQLPSPSRAAMFCSLYDVVISFKDSEREGEEIFHRETMIFDKLICSADQREIDKIDAHLHSAGKREGYAGIVMRDVTQRLATRVAGELLERFQRKSIFAFLRLKGQSLYTTVFTQPDGPLWSGETGKLWSAVLECAGDNAVVQKNLVESLELFGSLNNLDSATAANLIPKIWEAATARPVGRMWREELVKRRNQLTERGVNAGHLAIPEWLKPL
jgi:hypothetical protein